MSVLPPGPLVDPLRAFVRQLNDLGWSEPPDSTWRAARHLLLGRSWQLGLNPAARGSSCLESLRLSLPATLLRDLWPTAPPPDEAATTLLQAELPDDPPGKLYERLLELDVRWSRAAGWTLAPGGARRSAGAHYTPDSIADAVVGWTLEPLVSRLEAAELLQLKVCDPTMGAGVFLAAAAKFLARALDQRLHGEDAPLEPSTDSLRRVCSRCVFGIDQDPTAALLTRFNLWLLAGRPDREPNLRLACANSLLERGREPAGYQGTGLDLHSDFRQVFTHEPHGFDAVVGNPPWVAYVGRATQPLDPALKAHYAKRFRSFRRYRTLHGVFAERCGELLKPGGRLGLVLPTSMADLDGYAPTRAAHDVHCLVDEVLPDLGDGRFAGVFQPCMVLLSTRRRQAERTSRAWSLSRNDLDATSRGLLTRLLDGKRVPSECFGERGYQTTSADKRALRPAPDVGLVPLRSGTEVAEFRRAAPRYFADPSQLSQRLRRDEQWQEVQLLIRQTARYPIAASSDGLAFRNSIIAGFPSEKLPAPLLLCYLNSNLVRWYHYHRHRDARQGMPQLKVAHLRALPYPPDATTEEGKQLCELGAALAAANRGCEPETRRELDGIVFEAFGLTGQERSAVERWAAACPPPRPRTMRTHALTGTP